MRNFFLLFLGLALRAGTAPAAFGQAVAAAAPRPVAPAARPQAALLGKWQSLNDKRLVVELTPTRYVEHYAGQTVVAAAYQVSTRCGCADAKPVSYKNSVVITTRDVKDDDCYCYLINSLTSNKLSLFKYGQGGVLNFVRISK